MGIKATRLQTEYMDQPLGLGIRDPQFFWNCEGAMRQSAYRIVCQRDGKKVWDSGKVASDSMSHIAYEGEALTSRDRITWGVTLWDESGEEGETAFSVFEMGLLDASDWKAEWIAAPVKERKNERLPVDCFRKAFRVTKPVRKARLYASACGLYELRINGKKVGDGMLLPGNTDIRKRVQYQTFDVTHMLSASGHPLVLTAELADGWYRGTSGAFGSRNVYGRETKLLVQLEIEYEGGERQVIGTDRSWRWSNDGPIRFADLKDGEIVDARMKPSYKGKAVRAKAKGIPVPSASDNVLPKKQEHFKGTWITTPSGARVLDFGQNLAGILRFHIKGHEGQTIKIRLGESLDASGEFSQSNMQLARPVKEYNSLTEILFISGMSNMYHGQTQLTPLQEIHYTLREGENRYESKFTIFGFRYALVETNADISADDFESIAVYSDMEQTGTFDCSNADINSLVNNNRWSMKSNYCDVPTDCPTRERLAWTGDAQIYFNTGAYFMNTASFMRKWMRDMRDGMRKDGKLPAVVPYNGAAMCYNSTGGSAGWQDAAILVPYRFYKRYGDIKELSENYDMMKAAAMFMINHTGHIDKKKAAENPHNKYVYEKGMHLGEWLEPKEFREEISAKSQPTHPEECTAYLHYSMTCMEEAARVLGRAEDTALFREYAQGAKKAYQWLFLRDGAPDTDRQAKLVRPLAFGLAEGDTKRQIEERLAKAVENRNYTVGTGFLSTVFLLPTLTEMGRSDLAYQVLLGEECPGWIYQIRNGATTNWENWEGYIGDSGSGSLNHYSPGAVCEWIFNTSAGIRVTGENHFVIQPAPGGGLTYAKGTYASLYGTVESGWEVTEEGTSFMVMIPGNTTAEVILPNGETKTVEAGIHTFVCRSVQE